MPAPNNFDNSLIGPHMTQARQLVSGSATSYAMAALNTGYCVRFTAKDTRDIYTVYLNWSTVTTTPNSGVITVRIETIDTATGKPSGSLYDANATLAATPVSGWQAFTFATPPSTGLVAGNEYAVVVLTTTLGTAQTLRAYVSLAGGEVYPTIVLTAADGTTRTNFAEVSNSTPILTLVYSDGVEENDRFMIGAVTGTALNVYGTLAAGCKFILSATTAVDGVVSPIVRTGSPNDLRVRILDSSNAVVAGTTRTVSKNSLLNASSKLVTIPFPASVTLAAGTYRVVFDDSAQTGTNTNKYTLAVITLRSSALSTPGMVSTSCPNINTPVWTDDNTVASCVGLLLADIPSRATPQRALQANSWSFVG